jgi:5-methyltetrahydropteroyltriglutamate--homocysteine methyltransferase
MRRSDDRILTTHTGSLNRSEYLVNLTRHAHEWEVFTDVALPDGKILIPGVVDSASPTIEHPDLVVQRVQQCARLVGRENVIAGTDCGFGTFVGQAVVPVPVAWAKLRSLAEGARRASRKLWAA